MAPWWLAAEASGPSSSQSPLLWFLVALLCLAGLVYRWRQAGQLINGGGASMILAALYAVLLVLFVTRREGTEAAFLALQCLAAAFLALQCLAAAFLALQCLAAAFYVVLLVLFVMRFRAPTHPLTLLAALTAVACLILAGNAVTVAALLPLLLLAVSGITTTRCLVNFGDYKVKTTITCDSIVVKRFIEEVWPNDEPLLVGMDTEWIKIPRAHRVNNDPAAVYKTATLQLCVRIQDSHRCLLFQVCHADKLPEELKHFLESRRCIFVGSNITNDVIRLAHDHDILVAKTSELQEAAQVHFNRTTRHGLGLKYMCEQMLGLTLTKRNDSFHDKWGDKGLTMQHTSSTS